MTQEEKDLLLKDLCARLHSGVIVSAHYKDGEGWKTDDRKLLGIYEDGQVYVDCVYTNIENVKPYLRPMSNMTEEERKEYLAECDKDDEDSITTPRYHGIDWLNEHHFDFRNLINKGLAIDCTGLNIY